MNEPQERTVYQLRQLKFCAADNWQAVTAGYKRALVNFLSNVEIFCWADSHLTTSPDILSKSLLIQENCSSTLWSLW